MSGKVYLVGAGPGKSDLITIRGMNILKHADVVIYDYLVDRELLQYAKPEAELFCCDKLAKKGRFSQGNLKHQKRIADLIIKKTREGKKVIRLKNGDPSIFSRAREELDALVKARIEFEIVPGITAASAASSFAGIPLTDRRYASACVFITGQEDPTKNNSLIDHSTSLRVNGKHSRTIDWGSIINTGTVVLYMAVGNLELIVRQLIKAGKNKNTPVAIIQDVSLSRQRVITAKLKDIADSTRSQGIRPPAIIIIGEVARYEKRFNWLRKNKRILFTGLSNERFFLRGNYFHLPLIKIEPLRDYAQFDSFLKDIKRFDWIVFASRYAVEFFFKRLKAIGQDARELNGTKIAAIGNSTKDRLWDFNIAADLVPKDQSSKGLIEEFKKINLKNKSIFLPRSDISDKGLSRALKDLGAKTTTSFAYRNVFPEDLPALDLSNFNEIMFTSPSTVRNFKKRYKGLPKNIRVRCIGEVTLKEARRCRLLGKDG